MQDNRKLNFLNYNLILVLQYGASVISEIGHLKEYIFVSSP